MTDDFNKIKILVYPNTDIVGDGYDKSWVWSVSKKYLEGYMATNTWETGYAKNKEQALERARWSAERFKKKIEEDEEKQRRVEEGTHIEYYE